MALFNYFNRTAKVPSTEKTEAEIESKIGEDVNGPKKRGEYLKFSEKEKAVVAKYASEHGVAKAVRHFRGKNVKESSVRDWKRIYEKELKDKCRNATPGKTIEIASLPSKKQGRPPLLGYKLDQLLQEQIVSMRKRGTPISSHMVIGVARGLLLKHNRSFLNDFGGPITSTKDWAICVMRRMGYTKRRANSKSKVLPQDFKDIKEQYLFDVKSIVLMEDIPQEMILNWDQVGMKIVPSSAWTMEKSGTKRVEITAIDDKRQITAVFACSLAGSFLPIQLIYKGTTARCLPNGVKFPEGWNVTHSANHWSNTSTMLDFISCIIIPYITEKRKQLGLSSNHPALVIFDVFKGQCTEEVCKLLEDSNILYTLVPANCTDKLQPLDLSVNKPAKDFMKRQFQNWYGEMICKQLEDKVEEEVDMRLSVMKPLSARWLIDMHKYFVDHPSIIVNGFHNAGIVDALG